MSYQNKFEQLNKQSSLLAKKLEEIKKKQSSAASCSTVAPQEEKKADDKKVVTINNDGNFMENFLKMKNKKRSENLSGQTTTNQTTPIAKKSRYSSMFQQLKKSKQTGASSVESSTHPTANCFHGDSSSSDEEPAAKVRPTSSKFTTTPKEVRAAIINPITVNTASTSIKPIVSPASVEKTLKKEKSKPRKNRWGEKVDLGDLAPPGLVDMPGVTAPPTVAIPAVANLGLSYRPVGLAGMTQLNETQRKQLKEQQDMQAMYSLIMANRSANQIVAAQTAIANQKPKYEYDSDEEIDDKSGTWEHQKRRFEMEKTQALAEKLTEEGQGKHFIGDFLPPAELEKFMETYKALKEGRTPDYSDYKEFKIQCDNVGFKMLERMGWSEGQGLGSDSQGITLPVNQGNKSLDGRGLGVEKPDNLSRDDDDFSAYRKRMMLAYKFRPNPLNNPRRPYY